MLPGTLLGLFPGVMCDPNIPRPQTPKASALRPYLLRYDGWWLDYEKELRDLQNAKEIAELEVKSITKEQAKIRSKWQELKELLQKKEDILYHR